MVDATNDASRNVGSNRGETDQRRLVRSQLREAGADVLRPTHGICPLNDAHRNSQRVALRTLHSCADEISPVGPTDSKAPARSPAMA